jgi:Leucine-rich repeat (LRR) protein
MPLPGEMRRKYGLELDWENVPECVSVLDGISKDASFLRLYREGNSHRGLGAFTSITHLVISKVNQECIAEIALLKNLEFLYIEGCTAADLAPLSGCSHLRHLTIKGASKVANLDWLVPLVGLVSLGLESFKLIDDVSALSNLGGLTALALEGGMYKPQKIHSLLPISSLTQIEALFLTNCRVSTDGLRPLHSLCRLKHLDIAAFYEDVEFLELKRALPDLSCDWFDSIQTHGSIKDYMKSLKF